MRYNPATDRARYTLDEIAEQCRDAIMKAAEQRQTLEAIADLLFCDDLYDEVLTAARWEDDVLIPA